MSETAKIRHEAVRYCTGRGVDLGCGGDKVTLSAIGFDLEEPYTHVGDDVIEMKGDARELPFNDNVLDFVYSSHLLEDFPNTGNVLKEWIRVIKPGGYLILYLPDEKKYREYCKRTGHPSNEAHKIEEMSCQYIENKLKSFEGTIIKKIEQHGDYSFFIVWRKKEI